MLRVELICTGDEVLTGQIVDTNAAWLAQYLFEQGLLMQRKTLVGDRFDDLIAVFKERAPAADVIVVNGGLGPTTDDLSREAMAAVLNEPLVMHEAWKKRIESFFHERGVQVPESNYKQATMPQSAILIDNDCGTACGFRVLVENTWFFFTPGVPHEFKAMIQQQFMPFLQAETGLQTRHELCRLLVFGFGESLIQDQLADLMLGEQIQIGYRAYTPFIQVKVMGEAGSSEFKAAITKVKDRLGGMIVGENFNYLAEVIHALLPQKQQTLAIAESCTGGLVSSQLVEFPGSSAYLIGSVVAYSNFAKTHLLGIDEQVIQQEGAVSLEVATQMASQVKHRHQSDFGIAITGIAGPDGGTIEKPIGTVVIALATSTHVYVQQVLIRHRSRMLVRQWATAIAYDMLRRELTNTAPIFDYGLIQREADIAVPLPQSV